MHTFALVTPGPTEWVLILVIVLVLFGAKKLPELARSLGQSMNEFRKAREEFDKELRQAGQDMKAPLQGTQPYQAQPPAQTITQAPPVQAQSAPLQPGQSVQQEPPSQQQPTQPS